MFIGSAAPLSDLQIMIMLTVTIPVNYAVPLPMASSKNVCTDICKDSEPFWPDSAASETLLFGYWERAGIVLLQCLGNSSLHSSCCNTGSVNV